MRVVAMPGLDDLVANYHEVLARTVGGAGAALLQKNLQGSPLGHAGGQRFASTSDPNYQRWLAWVNAGAPSGIAAASEDAGVDAAAGDGGS